MDTSEFKEQVSDLGDCIDNLEEALQPLLKQNLSDITSKLPLLDKAKLNVLTAYAIESLIFSSLKLDGVDAKDHPVFTELTRVKQYFAKIKDAEEKGGSEKQNQNLKLDAPAASRFIKHALAGNDQYDRQRAYQQGKEKMNSKIKFDDLSEATTSASEPSRSKKRKAVERADSPSSSSISSSSSSSSEDQDASQPADQGSANKILLGKVSQKTKLREQVPSPTPSDQKKKSKRHNSTKSIKTKSNKAPRNSSAVFQDLLNRPKTHGKTEKS